MKHPYSIVCLCKRCTKERNRRERQSLNDGRRNFYAQPAKRTRKPVERRPVVGSAEWAETRGDDIDSDSGDY